MPSSITETKKFHQKYNHNIIFISETKISSRRIDRLKFSFNFFYYFIVDSGLLLGGWLCFAMILLICLSFPTH